MNKMRKQRLGILILFTLLLTSCFADDHDSAICTLKDDKTKIIVEAKYASDQVVESIEVKFTQTFSKNAVSDMSDEAIIQTLTSIFTENGNENVHIEVTYNNKKRLGEVYLQVPFENLSTEELKEYDLKKEIKVKDFIDKMETNEYKCEVKE